MKAQLIDTGLPAAQHFRIKTVHTNYLQSPFHFHDMCELVWIQESYGKRIVGDHIADFRAGDLVLMGANLPHIWLNAPAFRKSKKRQVQSTVIYFPDKFLLQLSNEQEIIGNTQRLLERAARGLHFFGRTQEAVAEKLATIEQQKGLQKIATFLQIMDILANSREYEYLAGIHYKHAYGPRDAQRINDVFRHVMQHFSGEIRLQELAAIACMTPPAFCRYFKKRTGKSPTRFINEIRIAHACELLLDHTRSIADVCYSSGYQNLTNFNKFFRLIRKQSPSQYRKEALQL